MMPANRLYEHPLLEVHNASQMRYRVSTGSESGHCCYEASVIDTEAEITDTCTHVVCECFDITKAKKIAKLLNSI